MLVFILHIEIFGLALSVMGGDKLLDDRGQIVFLCQFDTFRHMTDNHLGTIDGT